MRYLETVDLPIDALKPFPGNARVHDDDALDESARSNGQYRSVVARDFQDGYQILAGHGTVDAFGRAGDTHVRVELIEADDVEARRIVLADNGTSRNATYDDALLLSLLDAASAAGGLTGTGWDDAAHGDLVRLAGEFPTLDELEREHGTPADGDLWPTIKINVPHETRTEFLSLMEHPAFEAWNEEHERFAVILQVARTALDARS